MTPLIRFALVFTLTLVFAGVIHLYLYRRLVRGLTDDRRWRIAGAIIFASLFLGALAVRGFASSVSSEVIRAGSIAVLAWTGILLYLLVAVLTLDLGAWFWRKWRRPTPVDEARRTLLSRGAATASLLGAGGVGSFGAWEAFHPPEIREVPVRIPGLPRALDGFSIVQLSDIHVGGVIRRAFMDELVARANAAKPDLVAITGDLVDGQVPVLGPSVAALGNLRARYGTFFVTGNHDYYSGADAWVAFLQSHGLQVLRNRFVQIGDAGASFDLIGVDDWSAQRFGEKGYDLDQATAGRDPHRPSVLLAHQPAGFDEVARRGINLQLSGHTHGGQMFPGTLVADAIWGERSAGLSRTGDAFIYVSRGCGFVGPPMRVGAPPEVARIILLAA